MKMLGRVAAIAIVSALGLIPVHAIASTILWDFTVTVTTGPLAPDTIDGSFAYDSSSITPGGSNIAAGLLTQLNFSLNGITYNATTANTGDLVFDSTGLLTGFLIGNNCVAGVCTVLGGTDQWLINGFGTGTFGYADGGGGTGDVTARQVTGGAPEPAMWALLLAGFFGIGAMARRVRRSSRAALA